MRLLNVIATNFGSYDKLDFDYSNLGLTLVSGPTGSGKSTLMDVSCWALFGITAKEGSVDSIRNWNNSDNKTKVCLTLEHGRTIIQITRVRGKREENDLFWSEGENPQIFRAKDILETQKLLEARLGLNSKTYCSGSYHSEFSMASSFFTAKASDRRKLMESIVSLDFPILLSSKTSLHKKQILKKIEDISKEIIRLEASIQMGNKNLLNLTKSRTDWKIENQNEIKVCKFGIENFEYNKRNGILKTKNALNHFESDRLERIRVLNGLIKDFRINNEHDCEPCPTCGRYDEEKEAALARLIKELDQIKNKENPHVRELDLIKSRENNYSEKLSDLVKAANPFGEPIQKLQEDIDSYKKRLEDYIINKDILDEDVSCLEQLESAYSILRSRMIENSIQSVQATCNDYLIRFFDSEFTLSITPQSSDKLEVDIYKNGHLCDFSQLSKGQRGLLKLVFSLAIIKEINDKSGHRFNTIFLDEALDGLDPELKIKAFGLFCELESQHDSVLVIDHSEELKSMFDNRISVSLENENSVLRRL